VLEARHPQSRLTANNFFSPAIAANEVAALCAGPWQLGDHNQTLESRADLENCLGHFLVSLHCYRINKDSCFLHFF
jgi:hypothetical protein